MAYINRAANVEAYETWGGTMDLDVEKWSRWNMEELLFTDGLHK
jgi:hypothetical protein